MRDSIKYVRAQPLRWPPMAKRARGRKDSSFKRRTWANAEAELALELGRMHATHVVISSNVFDRSGRGSVPDPGVAVHFRRGNAEHVIACDLYFTASDNAYALAKTIEHLRGIERHGSTELGNQAFSAFAALPPSTGPAGRAHRHWREVLGVPDGIAKEDQRDLAETRYRKQTASCHPDKHGGDSFLQEELNGAIAMARRELA